MGPLGPALALACRIVLCIVLAVAAAGKLIDHAELPARLRAVGVDAGSRAIAVGLPIAEIATAVTLVAFPHSPLPAIAAIALLVAFSGFLVRTTRYGEPCPCFGVVRVPQAATAANGIVRNGLLVALAVLATGGIDGARPLGTIVIALAAAFVAGVAIARVA